MSLIFQSGVGTLNLFGSHTTDAAFVAANGPAVNGYAYYNTTLGAARAYLNSGWRTLYGSEQVATKTATYVATVDDDLLLLNANSAGFTTTLPTAVGNAGKVFTLKKIDATFNVATIATTSSQTIDGVVGTTLNTQNETLIVVSDNANWNIKTRSIPSNWTAYTGTFTGFGTLSAQSLFWRRSGDSVQIKGTFTPGTTTAVEARISIPSGLTSSATKIGSGAEVIGFMSRTANSATYFGEYVLVEASVSYVVFSIQSSTQGASTKRNGSDLGSSGENFVIQPCTIPISGWNG